MLYLITGGVRSGKSRLAERLARHISGEAVTYIATLQAADEEMRRRVRRHQAQRPASWETLELGTDLNALKPAHATLLLDCLSGFVSNKLLEREADGEEAALTAVAAGVEELLSLLYQEDRTVIIVTNEVGAGVVPPYPLGRWFRDALGLANQAAARRANAVALVTVGIPQLLKGDFPERFDA